MEKRPTSMKVDEVQVTIYPAPKGNLYNAERSNLSRGHKAGMKRKVVRKDPEVKTA